MSGSLNRQLRHLAARRRRIDQARRRLSAETLELVRLADAVGMRGSDIARELDVTPQRVHTILRRARALHDGGGDEADAS